MYSSDMSCFSNGISMRERQTNWKNLKKLFEYNKIPLDEEIVNKIINQAPNAAFEFLCLIYKYLTKKE
jgi:hypothetical protein